jgi:hypothetical protein
MPTGIVPAPGQGYAHADFMLETEAILTLLAAATVHVDGLIEWLRGKAGGGAQGQIKMMEHLRDHGEGIVLFAVRHLGVTDEQARGIAARVQAGGGLRQFVADKDHHTR